MEVNTCNSYSFVLHTVCMYKVPSYMSVCTNVQVEPTDTECWLYVQLQNFHPCQISSNIGTRQVRIGKVRYVLQCAEWLISSVSSHSEHL